MNDRVAMVILFTVAIASLTILALGYWWIMRQDSTVLTTVSAVIGGICGYVYKLLRVRKTEGEKQNG